MRSHLWTAAIALCLISVVAIAQEGTPPAPAPAPAAASIRITAELVDGVKILGEPIELENLPLKADFGSIDIPLRLLGTVESNKERTAVQCKFRNSDVLSGALEIDTLRLKTSYGEATIPLSRVNKLHFAEVK